MTPELNRYYELNRGRGGNNCCSSFNQGEKFFSRLLLSSETTEHAGSDGDRTRFLYSTHGHAHMAKQNSECRCLATSAVVNTHVASITTATPRGLIAS